MFLISLLCDYKLRAKITHSRFHVKFKRKAQFTCIRKNSSFYIFQKKKNVPHLVLFLREVAYEHWKNT